MKNKEKETINYSRLIKQEKCNISTTRHSRLFISIKTQIKLLEKTTRLNAECMIDMLHIDITNLNESFLSNLSFEIINTKNFHQTTGKIYNLQYKGKIVQFTIMTYHFREDQYTIQLQINPKHFDTLQDLLYLIRKITGSKIDKENHLLKRVDIAFILDSTIFTPTLLKMCARYKWKKKTLNYSEVSEFNQGDETGHRSSSRSTNYSAYCNTTKNKKMDNDTGIKKTKFEIQFRKNDLKKANIITLFDLKNLTSKSLFSKIELYNPLKANLYTRPQEKNFLLLQVYILNYGFHHSYYKLNKEFKNKFLQRYRKILIPLSTNHGKASVKYCLRKILKKWIRQYLNKENNISNSELNKKFKRLLD